MVKGMLCFLWCGISGIRGMCAPTDMKKNQNAKPHSQRLVQDAMTRRMSLAKSPVLVSPFPVGSMPVPTLMKSLGNARWAPSAIPIRAAAVKPEGPTETNMPGRVASWGSFCVIRRYINAA